MKTGIILALFIFSGLIAGQVGSADDIDTRRTSDISSTLHNLSTSGPGSVKSQPGGSSQVCVFCHTPHGATVDGSVAAPLWNKQYSSATYTKYDSESIQATIDDNPGGSSKLCLSCHDGTLAIGQVNVLEGSTNQNISIQGTQGGGEMPLGTDGYTRNLGTDLTNDHPISLVYDTALASADGELFNPSNDVDGQGAQVGLRGSSAVLEQPRFILEGSNDANAKLQCTSCHDPHLVGAAEDASINIKFLRTNRFQRNTHPTDGTFAEDTDILCLGCHEKLGWGDSAHARSDVAEEIYEDSAANLREFPTNLKVWEAGCLNCHDTHSKQGSRRLLREGSTGSSQNDSAIEEACYQCHQPQGGSNALQTTNNDVPDIKTDFTSTYRMPIVTADQEDTTKEVHEIVDADFTESVANLNTRHVECTDCHNPHRVKKTQRIDNYQGSGPDAEATHDHSASASAAGHTNIASGVLTGAFGVEPQYASPVFSPEASTINTITFNVKKGMPAGAVDDTINNTTYQWNTDPDNYGFVTREYQVCLKCHSNYAFGTTPPSLNTSANGGSSGVNGVTEVTNQAMEFQAPSGHVGEGTATPSGWGVESQYETNNHRSWHPVMKPTGRTAAVRTANANQWLSPWDGGVGTQTMYCSDCHGNNTASGTSAPTGSNPWGPHGSTNPFILKGDWSPGDGVGANELCFRCHDENYRSGKDDTDSGFFDSDTGKGDLHDFHVDRLGQNLKCTWCHVALPHGWKNKAFLVNIMDVGPECAGNAVGSNKSANFTCAPYYQNAYLAIVNFAQSGDWSPADCGRSASNNDKEWMTNTCDNPN